MPPPTPPEDPVEREYRSLTRKLLAARGFCFIVYFVDDGSVARRLRVRLADDLAARGRRLVVLAADAPEAMVGPTLAGTFEAAQAGGQPVVWVEAFRDAGDAAWDVERRSLLMRMNERRSRLEAELRAPLVLLLPGAALRDAASLAPDLWHVRLHSAALASDASAAAPWEASPPSIDPQAPVTHPSAADELPQAVAYWHSVEAGAEVGQPLFDGFRAVQAWLRAGRPADAAALATRLVARARARVEARLPDDDATAATVELAIALKEQGAAVLQLGRFDDAIAVLEQSARLLHDAGDDAATAGLLTVVQKTLGDALLDTGRPREAEARFRDSLATLTRLGADPAGRQSQVAAALHVRIGDAAAASGDARAAFDAYGQSVADWRRLGASSGGDAGLRRSLATALGRLGNAQAQLGRGERALGSFAEAAALLRALPVGAAGDASVERELASLLVRRARSQQAAGRSGDALGACTEALALARTLAARGDDAGGVFAALEAVLERFVSPDHDPAQADAAAVLLDAVRAARK